MNRSQYQDAQGYHTTRRSNPRYNRKAVANKILSTIIWMVAITMLMSTKNTLAFTSIVKVNKSPACSAVCINRCTNRITSQGSVQYQSERSYVSRHRRHSARETNDNNPDTPPVLVSQGLFAVDKPLEWTSQDVTAFIRAMFERDARERGVQVGKLGSKKNRHLPVIRVGHGGTLDPLATGVLVIGLGNGTKLLPRFLTGSKGYRAEGTFGFETESLDMGTNVTKTEKFDHITRESLEAVLPHFKGRYLQDPPIYSAIHKDGKRLYELARNGVTAKDIDIKPRAVEVFELDLLDFNLPKFEIEMFSASGFYVRSVIRDIGYSLDSVATTTKLQRIKQGPFTMDHVLRQDDWTIENINEAIDAWNEGNVVDEPVNQLPAEN